ncbi:MAG: 3-oxoacyl-ACP synthase, partial [Phototrophicales bacterium]
MTDLAVGIAGIGTFFPARTETAADLVARTGIPEDVLREKMGIRQRHVAGDA